MATGSKPNPLSLCYDALVAYYIASPALATVLILFLIVVAFGVAGAIWESATGTYSEYKFNQIPPAEHLRIAREACNVQKPEDSVCMNPSAASPHLDRVPHESPEYADASKLIEMIRRQQQAEAERQRQIVAGQEAERTRLTSQTQQESFAQMGRNVAGTAHDAYRCATSTTGATIVSFDSGNFWWADDGRCAAEEQKRRDEQQAALQREQRQRDDDAQASSYWPTTIRVETDMDSFWLNNEERTCVTAPDANGRVARVTCSSNGSHQDHSIPVRFWGGVDRNTISNWKCRREGDEFVCRAID